MMTFLSLKNINPPDNTAIKTNSAHNRQIGNNGVQYLRLTIIFVISPFCAAWKDKWSKSLPRLHSIPGRPK